MATESVDRRSSHLRGLTVTTLAALAGVAAALASATVVGSTPAAAQDRLGLAILVAFVLVQAPVLFAAGIDPREFSTKDYLYVAFMTFALWFVTWAVLLTAGITL